MSKLLFDESPLVVQPTLATAIGLNEALILQQIHYWLRNPKAGKEVEGERWIYDSLSDWKVQFPWWSESTIYRTLKSLEERGLIKSGNFNKRKGDRTKWYTIDYAAYAALEEQIARKSERDSVKVEPEPPSDAETDADNGGDRNSIFQNETASCHNETSSSQNGTTLPETSSEISPEISPIRDDAAANPEPPNIFQLYENLGLFLNPIIADELREAENEFPPDWIHEAFKRAAAANARNWRYIRKILDNWKDAGGIDDPGARSDNGKEKQPEPTAHIWDDPKYDFARD